MIAKTLTPARKGIGWREVGLVAALVLVALGLRLYDLTGESLWYDEAYSVWISKMNIASLKLLWDWKIEFSLYYLLFHYWMRLFGSGELAVRLFGALAGTATVIPMYLLGRELFNRGVGVLGALLLAINPYHIWYSQEVRMHSWAVLLVLLSLYTFWRLVQGGKWGWWLAHILITGLGLHLHYYLAWTILAENAFFVGRWWLVHPQERTLRGAWRGLRAWLLDEVLVLLVAIPAIAVFLARLTATNDWGWLVESYRAPGLRDVASLFSAYTVGSAFRGPAALRWGILAVYLALGGWGWWWSVRQPDKEREGGWLALLAVGLPVGLILAVGQFAAIWVLRYLLLFLPAFLLLVAAGIAALGSRGMRLVAIALALGVSFYALSGSYGVIQKEDWRGVAHYLSAHVAPNDVIVLMDEECRVPFNYYYGEGGLRVEVSRFADDRALDQAVADIEKRSQSGHVWLVVSHADGSGLQKRLQGAGEFVGANAPAFVGVKLVAYDRP